MKTEKTDRKKKQRYPDCIFIGKFRLALKTFFVILENFCYCLIQKTLGELPDFEVMTWQLCNLLRPTLNCLQGTLILLQRYEFYLYIKSTVLFIMSLR